MYIHTERQTDRQRERDRDRDRDRGGSRLGLGSLNKIPCQTLPHWHSQDSWLTNRYFEISLLLRGECLHIDNLRKFWMHKIHDVGAKECSTKFCLRVSSGEGHKVKPFKGAVLVAKSFDPVGFEHPAHHAHCFKNHWSAKMSSHSCVQTWEQARTRAHYRYSLSLKPITIQS